MTPGTQWEALAGGVLIHCLSEGTSAGPVPAVAENGQSG